MFHPKYTSLKLILNHFITIDNGAEFYIFEFSSHVLSIKKSAAHFKHHFWKISELSYCFYSQYHQANE
jgi:hypothetical protein